MTDKNTSFFFVTSADEDDRRSHPDLESATREAAKASTRYGDDYYVFTAVRRVSATVPQFESVDLSFPAPANDNADAPAAAA